MRGWRSPTSPFSPETLRPTGEAKPPEPSAKRRWGCWHVAVVAETLARLKGIDVGEVEEVTSRNMRRMLGRGWETVRGFVGGG